MVSTEGITHHDTLKVGEPGDGRTLHHVYSTRGVSGRGNGLGTEATSAMGGICQAVLDEVRDSCAGDDGCGLALSGPRDDDGKLAVAYFNCPYAKTDQGQCARFARIAAGIAEERLQGFRDQVSQAIEAASQPNG